jgi:hypothetical protein
MTNFDEKLYRKYRFEVFVNFVAKFVFQVLVIDDFNVQ